MRSDMDSFTENLSVKQTLLDDQISLIRQGVVPEHVAIIMDGNRRWSRQKGLSTVLGHAKGAEVLIEIVKAASSLGVRYLTVYSFSTENWSRSTDEVQNLLELFCKYLITYCDFMVQEGVRLEFIGDLSRFPQEVRNDFQTVANATKKGSRFTLILALSYGGRDEICRAVQKILKDQENQKIPLQQVTEELISRYLDTAKWPDPDLLIRTSGELRLSNFLLWQLSYSEFYFCDALWPDFSPQNLYEAILSFQQRLRRKGGGI